MIGFGTSLGKKNSADVRGGGQDLILPASVSYQFYHYQYAVRAKSNDVWRLGKEFVISKLISFSPSFMIFR